MHLKKYICSHSNSKRSRNCFAEGSIALRCLHVGNEKKSIFAKGVAENLTSATDLTTYLREKEGGRNQRASVVYGKYCHYVCIPGLIVPPSRNRAAAKIKD